MLSTSMSCDCASSECTTSRGQERPGVTCRDEVLAEAAGAARRLAQQLDEDEWIKCTPHPKLLWIFFGRWRHMFQNDPHVHDVLYMHGTEASFAQAQRPPGGPARDPGRCSGRAPRGPDGRGERRGGTWWRDAEVRGVICWAKSVGNCVHYYVILQ